MLRVALLVEPGAPAAALVALLELDMMLLLLPTLKKEMIFWGKAGTLLER
jgi:hypothetical protein